MSISFFRNKGKQALAGLFGSGRRANKTRVVSCVDRTLTTATAAVVEQLEERLAFSITPIITDTGLISLSLDALGTNAASGNIRVQKPAGGTVLGAYLMSTKTSNSQTAGPLNTDLKIDGVNPTFSTTSTTNGFGNSFADVTSLVKAKIDAAPTGLVNFTIAETVPTALDGEILAVIFNDPTQTSQQTIVLLFGGQVLAGDNFAVTFAQPIDKTNPNLKLDMSLGISFSYQENSTQQYSLVDVNSQRLTTSAGGSDDNRDISAANGNLITVGGIGDLNDNPANPNATPTNARSDDELYSLIPFVNNGDTTINVHTQNPSNDDNIMFAAFTVTGQAIVNEGILLAPPTQTHNVGQQATVNATVKNSTGQPIVGRTVTFKVTAGPDTGTTGSAVTDINGNATFSYTGASAGTDTIVASFVNSSSVVITSASVSAIFNPIANATPVVTGVSNTSTSPCGFTLQGQSVTITGTFTDADTTDTHTAVVTFGDGTTGVGTVNEVNHTVTASHIYTSPDSYIASIVVKDSANNSSVGGPTTTVLIAGAKLDTAGNLEVDGTNCDDTIRVAKANASGSLLSVRFGNTFIGNYSPTGKIIVNGRDGNDYLSVDANVTRATIIYGGNGNDSIRGGGGSDILLGNDGNDAIFGGGGANILIGGNGADNLQGGTAGDVMIGGSTSYDAVQASLIALSNEWAGANTYAVRISNLKTGGGAAAGVPLNGNVLDDGTTDVLASGGGQDFFLANTAQDSLIGVGASQVN